MKNKGFTLIELLVVVAIIGILASVVLASLNSARSKGADAKIKSQLKNIITATALYYDTNSNYGISPSNSCGSGVFWGDTTSGLSNLTNTDNYPSGTALACYSSSITWAVSAKLSSNYWCVDSSGVSRQTSTGATSAVCPSSSEFNPN